MWDWLSHTWVLLVPVKNGNHLPTHNCRRSGEAQMDLRSGFAQHWQVSRYTTCMTKSFLTCCLSMIRKKSDVCAPILQTVYKGARIPRFFWEWTCMRKHSIPGHSLSSHAAWEQGYHHLCKLHYFSLTKCLEVRQERKSILYNIAWPRPNPYPNCS